MLTKSRLYRLRLALIIFSNAQLIPLPIAFFDGGAFVVFFFTGRECQFALNQGALPIKRQGHAGKPFLLHAAN